MGRKIVPIKEEYFDWLINYTIGGGMADKYRYLCSVLHFKRFRWTVRNDDNRCADGVSLRDRFVDMLNLDKEHTETVYFRKGDCTVLELLVAIAERMNGIMYDLDDRENHTKRWMMEMLDNLNLSRFSDPFVKRSKASGMIDVEIDDILETFMGRTYAYDGYGGLFPLKKRPEKDQTRVEIWYQMMGYLEENYS